MADTSTERAKTFRQRRQSGEIRERAICVYVPDDTYQLLVSLTHKAGPGATLKSTIAGLIEKERFQQ